MLRQFTFTRSSWQLASCENHSSSHLELTNTTCSKRIKYLIDQESSYATLLDKYNNTPLHFAVNNKSKIAIELIKALKNAGADINAKNCDGRTALHNATDNLNIDILNTLIQLNANIYASDRHGRQPLHLACLNENVQAIEVLLAAGAKPGCVDDRGFTPIDYVVKYNLTLAKPIILAADNSPAKIKSKFNSI